MGGVSIVLELVRKVATVHRFHAWHRETSLHKGRPLLTRPVRVQQFAFLFVHAEGVKRIHNGLIRELFASCHHRMSPYLHRTARIHPGGKATLRGWSIGTAVLEQDRIESRGRFLSSSPGRMPVVRYWQTHSTVAKTIQALVRTYGILLRCVNLWWLPLGKCLHDQPRPINDSAPFFSSERQVLANEVSDLVE